MRVAHACFLLILSLAVAACQPQRVFPRDRQGRDIVLHGLNISNAAKADPAGVGWHTQADYARMAAWGFNTVRLLVFWSKIEPAPGVFDDGYLDLVEERVNWAAGQGLHVLIDMHQDLYSAKFGGDGAPEWAIRDDGLPFDPVSPWWMNMLAPAVRASFSHFWRDADLQGAYFAIWGRVASRFAGNPAVIGYDVMNEPFMGNEPLTRFEPDRLYPFYQGAAAAIRGADPAATVFFEPSIIVNSGLFLSALPPIGPGRWLYAPHFYQVNVHEGGAYNGKDGMIVTTLAERALEASTQGVPWILGEFGVAVTTPGFEDYLRDILRELDRNSAGWTYYSYDDDNGDAFGVLYSDRSEKKALLDTLIRPYPAAVAGAIATYAYNPSTRRFDLTFEEREGAIGPTEIRVPASRVYPEGFVVQSTDAPGTWSYTFDAAREVLRVTTDPSRPSHTLKVEPLAG